MADATDPALAGQWLVEDDSCYPRRALDEWAKEHPDDVGSAILRVRLASEANDPTTFQSEIEAAYRRHGLNLADETGGG